MRINKIKNEIYEIKKWDDKMKQEDLKYKTKRYTYNFQLYETIRPFGHNFDKARWAKAIYLKIQQNFLINLDQEQQKVKIKKEVLMRVHMLFMKVEN